MIKARNETLLVLGGTGFIGVHLVTAARDIGLNVYVLSLNNIATEDRLEDVTYFQCNICNFPALKHVIGELNFDYVVNLSGYINHAYYFAGGIQVINEHLRAVENLIQCLNRDTLCAFVQVGSSDEYGDQTSPQNEDMLTRPISPYSYAKSAAGSLLQMLHRTEGYPATVVRIFLTYGPMQDERRFLPQIIGGCLKDEKFPTSAGEQLRDFCYVGDIVRGILMVLSNTKTDGEVINLASGIPVKIRTMVEHVVDIIGAGKPDYGVVGYRVGENMKLYADVRKANDILDWSAETSLKEGLEKTISYYKTQFR